MSNFESFVYIQLHSLHFSYARYLCLRIRKHIVYVTKGKPIRPLRPSHLRQPPRGNTKPFRPNIEKVRQKSIDEAIRRDSTYGAPAPYNPPAPQPKVILCIKILQS